MKARRRQPEQQPRPRLPARQGSPVVGSNVGALLRRQSHSFAEGPLRSFGHRLILGCSNTAQRQQQPTNGTERGHMANHKRGRPKNGRAGCLLCKPWKVNGFAHRRRLDGEAFGAARARRVADLEIHDYWEQDGSRHRDRAEDR